MREPTYNPLDKQQAEGSRDVVERELKRREGDPADCGGEPSGEAEQKTEHQEEAELR